MNTIKTVNLNNTNQLSLTDIGLVERFGFIGNDNNQKDSNDRSRMIGSNNVSGAHCYYVQAYNVKEEKESFNLIFYLTKAPNISTVNEANDSHKTNEQFFTSEEKEKLEQGIDLVLFGRKTEDTVFLTAFSGLVTSETSTNKIIISYPKALTAFEENSFSATVTEKIIKEKLDKLFLNKNNIFILFRALPSPKGAKNVARLNSNHSCFTSYKGIGVGSYNYIEGQNNTAYGTGAHAEGKNTLAVLSGHSEGESTQALQNWSHAEGYYTTASGEAAHAEGKRTISSNSATHAEGYGTEASGSNAHSEGNGTKALGDYSHAEGLSTEASGNSSHAEGNKTIARGSGSHAAGYQTEAMGNYSKADGYKTIARGSYSHAQGGQTISVGNYSHSEGSGTKAYGRYSHTEGYNTQTSKENGTEESLGRYAHAEGYSTTALGQGSHSEGSGTKTTGGYSHAEGFNNEAQGYYSHAEGSYTCALGSHAHAEGTGEKLENGTINYTYAMGNGSHAEGFATQAKAICSHTEGYKTLAEWNTETQAGGRYSHAEGYGAKTEGDYSHAEGYYTVAKGMHSHTEGRNTKTEGDFSHAEGEDTSTKGRSAHAQGKNTKAYSAYSFASGWGSSTGSENYKPNANINIDEHPSLGIAAASLGRWCNAKHNASFVTGRSLYTPNENCTIVGQFGPFFNDDKVYVDQNMILFGVGTGTDTGSSRRELGFYVTPSGISYKKALTNGGDYAEYFEWVDQNKNNEDRIGHFVSLTNGNYIQIAQPGDEIIGIISGTAGIIGNAYDIDWHDKYKKDVYGRILYETVEIDDIELNDFGEEITIKRKITRPISNPNYNPNEIYIPRAQRSEWAVVGLLGQLIVNDDGTCVPGGKCTCGINGIAIASNTGYHVLKRLDATHIQILLK